MEEGGGHHLVVFPGDLALSCARLILPLLPHHHRAQNLCAACCCGAVPEGCFEIDKLGDASCGASELRMLAMLRCGADRLAQSCRGGPWPAIPSPGLQSTLV